MKNDFEFDPYLQDWRPRKSMGPPVAQGISNTVIPNFSPHYTDDRFKKETLIWGTEKADFWNYSDRMLDWYGQKMRDAQQQAQDEGCVPQSSMYVQRWLQILHEDDELVLQGIMSYHHQINGYPYQVYGYKTSKS